MFHQNINSLVLPFKKLYVLIENIDLKKYFPAKYE